MPYFKHDGLEFHYLERGEGTPVIFQHGMGGNAEHVLSPFHQTPSFQLLSFDFRGHGKTKGIGSENKLGFQTFADDVIAFLDPLGLESAIIGGSSMGAGVALNLALRYGKRVKGLIILRPAWLDKAFPTNLIIHLNIIELLRDYGKQAQSIFEASKEFKQLRLESKRTATTLLAEFSKLHSEEQLLIRQKFISDAPITDLGILEKKLKLPTLVLGQDRDPTHPLEYAKTVAKKISGATFKQLTSNSVNPEQYARDLQNYVESFLSEHSNTLS